MLGYLFITYNQFHNSGPVPAKKNIPPPNPYPSEIVKLWEMRYKWHYFLRKWELFSHFSRKWELFSHFSRKWELAHEYSWVLMSCSWVTYEYSWVTHKVPIFTKMGPFSNNFHENGTFLSQFSQKWDLFVPILMKMGPFRSIFHKKWYLFVPIFM